MGNHSGIGGMGIENRVVPAAVGNRGLLLSELVDIVHDLLFRGLDRRVGNRRGPHQEERVLRILLDELLQLVVHQVAGVVFLVEFIVTPYIIRVCPGIEPLVDGHVGVPCEYSLVVFPEVVRVV